ncbi:MAG: STAS domain-containing protein [Thermoanaerobaculia bacterium]|nr:STAS domain-containing protein [Thermoanaerobaculia bacterium]
MELYRRGTEGDVLILAADGGLSLENSERFVDDLEAVIDQGDSKLIVDCEKLTHISSFGIGVLVRLHRRLAAQGANVKLACVDSRIVQILEMGGLASLFEIYPDVGTALDAFGPDPAS